MWRGPLPSRLYQKPIARRSHRRSNGYDALGRIPYSPWGPHGDSIGLGLCQYLLPLNWLHFHKKYLGDCEDCRATRPWHWYPVILHFVQQPHTCLLKRVKRGPRLPLARIQAWRWLQFRSLTLPFRIEKGGDLGSQAWKRVAYPDLIVRSVEKFP